MSRRQRPVRHRLEYAALRAVTGLCAAVPDSLADRTGAAVGWLAGRTLRPRWDVVMRQLRIAFPDASDAWRTETARRSYIHLGAEAVAMFRLAQAGSAGIRERTTVTGLEVLEDAARRGQGVMLVSGHLGNWETGASAIAVRGFPLDAVVARQRNPFFDRYLTRSREGLGMTIIPRGDARRGVVASLRAGRVVGILGDQDARRAGIFVDFFGRPAATARGPAVLCLRAGARMATFFSLRLPGAKPRYRVDIQPVEADRRGNLADDVTALTQAFTKRLEGRVRAHPTQYFWLHRRWKTPWPGTAAEPYAGKGVP